MKIQQTLDRQGIVHTDPEIMSGVPGFVGTRVPLQTFFDYLELDNGAIAKKSALLRRVSDL